MGFRILDASAFYAGVPFRSPGEYCTTPQVYDEVRHIKKDHGALDTLLGTGRLRIMEPRAESVEAAARAAKGTGDFGQLSGQDVSVIALGLEVGGHIVTDDYAVSNVAGNLGIRACPVMTAGIRDVGRWVSYCPGCGTGQESGKECARCGTPLKRRLVKGRGKGRR